jgi:hypothetical protein
MPACLHAFHPPAPLSPSGLAWLAYLAKALESPLIQQVPPLQHQHPQRRQHAGGQQRSQQARHQQRPRRRGGGGGGGGGAVVGAEENGGQRGVQRVVFFVCLLGVSMAWCGMV